MAKWTIEYCGRGGTFGMATVEANTASEACDRVNGSSLVGLGQEDQTRARIYWSNGKYYSTRSEALEHGDDVFCGTTRG